MISREILFTFLAVIILAFAMLVSSEESYRIYNHHFLIRRSHPTKRPLQEEYTTHDENTDEIGSTADVSVTKAEMGDLQYDEDDYEDYDNIFKGFKVKKEELEKDYSKYLKKYSHHEIKDSKLDPFHENVSTTTIKTETILDDIEYTSSTQTTFTPPTSSKPSTLKMDDPLALPVTTEGKKTEDPLKVYGMPKELLPIMPGGGSRFDDIEREKIEQKKMAQMKGGDESVENGGSHEAESLYSSGSLSSFYLCFYSIVSFLLLDRVIL